MPNSALNTSEITGVILAGGKGRRMGGKDKGLIEVNGSPLIELVINAFAPQVGELIINANRNISDYEQYGYKVIQDELPGFQGPLAGMLAGLRHASNELVVFVPCDTATLINDLVQRLWRSKIQHSSEVSVAHDGTRMHGVYALLEKKCAESLERYLKAGNRRVEDWVKSQNYSTADCSDVAQSFHNINSAEDLRNQGK